MSLRFFSVVFFLILIVNNSTGQNSPGLKNFTPVSPDAAALGKYGEIPVGTYTGIPGISIPVFTVKSRELELPVSLSYHSGGIRVEEIASWVGIGFSLNAGGVITRSVRGLPDDYSSGTSSQPNTLYSNTIAPLAKKYLGNQSAAISFQGLMGNGKVADLTMLDYIGSQITDGEPDVFYFNFGKYTGSFIIGENGQFIISPAQALKIEFTANTIYGSRDATQWTLTTPDGVKYIFGVSSDGRVALEKNDNGGTRVAITSWYLLDIFSPDNDVISLAYNTIYYNYKNKSGEVNNLVVEESGGGAGVDLPPLDKKIATNYMTMPKLASITFASGKLIFTSASSRTDLPGNPPLNSISIFNNADLINPLKKFVFNYDYSNGGRLTLKNLQELTASSLPSGNTHTFEYNGPSLPNPDPEGTAINSQDLWGYFNGITNSVLPQSLTIITPGQPAINIFGANRHTDEYYMKAGSLKKIIYPTGGWTTFDFEANRVYSADMTDGIPITPVGKGASLSYNTGETKTANFTVSTVGANGIARVSVMSRAQTQGCPISPSGFSTCYTASVQGINGTIFPAVYFIDGSSYVDLPNGSYQIVGQGLVVSGQPANTFYLTLAWDEYPPPTGAASNKIVGGLRIQRITNYDGITTSIKKYLYNKFSSSSESSAVLVNYPSCYATMFQYVGGNGATLYAQVRSYPLIPLLPTQGSTLGYQNVTELQGENGENGKTEYTYTTANDYPDEIKNYRPFPPPCSYDLRRGQLQSSIEKKNDNGIFYPVKSITNNYVVGATPKTAYGITFDKDVKQIPGGTYTYVFGPGNYYVAGYKTISEFNYLQSAATRIYDQANSGNYTETVNSYAYDNTAGHYQLKTIVTTNSKNQPVQTDYKYPQDVTLTGTAEIARTNLISKFMLTPVLQQTLTTNSIQTTDTKNYYKVFSNGLVLPESIETKTGSMAAEKRVEFLKYNNYGNIVQQHKMNDVLNTVIWDYNNTYPVAVTSNADSANIAYTSFEADGKGNWAFTGTPVTDATAPTGRKTYNLSAGTITKAITSTATYIISYWRPASLSALTITGTQAGYPITGRTVNGWKYIEHKVTGSSSASISGTGLIDELRLYPANALMTTNTYDPLIGITSQCDANSRINYYDYDAFGRLMLIRDQDRNILKKICYNYAGQPENCNTWVNAQRSGGYQKTNCSGCQAGSMVTYTVGAGLYSSSISQADADQKARTDADTNGPIYANANGTCSTPATVPVTATNAISTKSFTIEFRNTCTNIMYGFSLNASASNVSLSPIPQGTYNVTFSPVGGGSVAYTYRINGFTIHTFGGTIQGVNLIPGGNIVTILP